MALVGGVNAVPGRIMGHSGMWNNIGEPTAQDKKKTLADAGCTVVDHPAQFGEVMKGLLAGKRPTPSGPGSISASQSRGLHTLARRLPRHQAARPTTSPRQPQQKRGIWLTKEQSLEQLEKYTVPIGNATTDSDASTFRFAISLDRVQRQLRLVGWTPEGAAHEVPFHVSLKSTSPEQFTTLVTKLMGELGVPKEHLTALAIAFHRVRRLYTDLEAISVYFAVSSAGQEPAIVDAHVQLDDAAFKSSKRVAAVHKTRRVDLEDADEVAAEKYGIVYVKLEGEGSIGTVVNGAGLAMNLVDAIEARGGSCANFLDTGGKATQETVKASFESVLKDDRVKVVFVNIFGGLTLCDMIANGVLLAYKDLGISLPVVVRLRGTNEAEGQKIIADSGLPMFAFDDFEEAAQKCIELAKEK